MPFVRPWPAALIQIHNVSRKTVTAYTSCDSESLTDSKVGVHTFLFFFLKKEME
jgi:hypothetical protein